MGKMIINTVNMPNFTGEEIPPYVAKYMDTQILSNIQKYRDILGCPFNVSSDPGAMVRFDGRKTSEHYVIINPETDEIEKYSRAIDGFPRCNIFDAWVKALLSNLFGGIGVYFDTFNNQGIPQPMLHLDLRSKPLIWYRNKRVYYYPHKYFFKKLLRVQGASPHPVQ